jgi:hypothetical protein
MSTIPANPWNGAMFLVPRREGKVELWASWSLDAAMGRAVRLHLAARLYLSSARRHELSIQEEAQMVRILFTVAFALLLTNFAMAQSYCDQVRQAVATYGYAAAKQHAMAHYSPREVAVADKCVSGGHRTKRRK